MVGAVFLVGFLVLTIVHEPPLERMADPTDTGYIPLPDWYFLFLYQLLKYEYAAGPYTVVGAIIIPTIAFGALLLAPFLDRGPERRPFKRPVAVGLMLLAISATVFLTWQSVVTHDWAAAEEQGKIKEEADIDTSAEGYKIYQEQGCISCHGDNMQGGAAGPSLVDNGLSPEEIAKIAKEGKGEMPAGVLKDLTKSLKNCLNSSPKQRRNKTVVKLMKAGYTLDRAEADGKSASRAVDNVDGLFNFDRC